MRSSTRQKGTDFAKKTAMAELVAAKNARARKTGKKGDRRGRYTFANAVLNAFVS